VSIRGFRSHSFLSSCQCQHCLKQSTTCVCQHGQVLESDRHSHCYRRSQKAPARTGGVQALWPPPSLFLIYAVRAGGHRGQDRPGKPSQSAPRYTRTRSVGQRWRGRVRTTRESGQERRPGPYETRERQSGEPVTREGRSVRHTESAPHERSSGHERRSGPHESREKVGSTREKDGSHTREGRARHTTERRLVHTREGRVRHTRNGRAAIRAREGLVTSTLENVVFVKGEKAVFVVFVTGACCNEGSCRQRTQSRRLDIGWLQPTSCSDTSHIRQPEYE
jgi:hypothetical protein